MAELDRREMMMAFIDAHREDLGIEPICRELAIAPSSYHEHAGALPIPAGARRVPAAMTRSRADQACPRSQFRVYGSRKVWHQLLREAWLLPNARWSADAPMGLAGVRRGKTTITTVSNPEGPCPLDKVNREFAFGPTPCGWSILPTVRLERICLECLGERRIRTNALPSAVRGHEPKRR
jgi:hypothetical protein